MSHSRRTFLQQVSAATAVGLLGQVPGRELWALPPAELVPEPDEALLRELALRAVEAARAAGATFADVRVATGRRAMLSAGFNRLRRQRPAVGWPGLRLRTAYGIRAVMDGAWGFAGATTLTPDAIAEAARTAVARARLNRPRRPRTLELAPAPRVEQGTWATPIVRDPFAVPVGEQGDLALAALAAAEGVQGVSAGAVRFVWTQCLRVFASSEGALTAQRVALAWPSTRVTGRSREDHAYNSESVGTLLEGGYGYEAVSHTDLVAELRGAAERAVAESRPRVEPTSVEVGRYDLVLGGAAAAQLLAATLAEAVDLERALGYQANRAGTSFAAPPAEILGRYQVGGSSLTVRADRTRPHAAATVGWDDEGVRAGEHTLIDGGVIVDYLTTRQTAPALADWYTARGGIVCSRGCASGAGEVLPGVRLPNLTLEPGADDLSVDSLVADTRRGFYVPACWGSSDQQVLNSQFGASGVREIRNGRLGEVVGDFAFQFITPELWRRIDALGGPGSVIETRVGTGLSTIDPLQLPSASVRAVPMRVREVNVLNTGRTS